MVTDDGERCPVSGSTGNRSFLCRVVKVAILPFVEGSKPKRSINECLGAG